MRSRKTTTLTDIMRYNALYRMSKLAKREVRNDINFLRENYTKGE